jgi:hypothetical protein
VTYEIPTAFTDWAATRLLVQIRSGRLPVELTPGDLTWGNMVDAVRSRLNADDRRLVLTLLEEEVSVMWGDMLSRAVEGDDVTAALDSAFEALDDVDRKLGLLHHLSARRLEPGQVRRLMAWASLHASALIEEQRRMFSGPDGPARLMKRLDDPMYAQKRWVYMYSLHALDRATARRLLAHYQDDDDLQVRQAAADSARHLACRVFISYRRRDVPDFCGRLHDPFGGAPRLGLHRS